MADTPLRKLGRAIRRRVVSSSPWTILLAIIGLSLLTSYGGYYLVVDVIAFDPERVKTIAGFVGYLGGLIAFVPVATSAILGYKLDRLDIVIGELSSKEAKAGLENERPGVVKFANDLKARLEFCNTLGFILMTFAFLLTI